MDRQKVSKGGHDTLIISPMSISGVVEGTLKGGWGGVRIKTEFVLSRIDVSQ